mmetsp:Transcript_739/g.1570  ORF Transcript_739/g.1570 Transcript_739/m.1570 type:complete len:117 (+) Transcript_739:69-419(+)
MFVSSRPLIGSKAAPVVCTCGVYEEEYHSHGEKAPKILRCGHSSCSKCIGKLTRPNAQGERAVICPTCRVETIKVDVRSNYMGRDAVAQQWEARDDLVMRINTVERNVGDLAVTAS